eukprot:1411531-Prorocentrum_lima.AAC.1
MTSSLVGSEMCIRDRIVQVLFHDKHFGGGGIALSVTQRLVEAAKDANLDFYFVPFHVPCLVLVVRNAVI